MPARNPNEAPPPRARKPWYKKRRNQRRVFYLSAAAIAIVAAVLVLNPSWLFPQTSSTDNTPTLPGGFLGNQVGVEANLTFSAPASLQYAFQPSQINCPGEVSPVSAFICNVQLINTDPNARTVSSPTLQSGAVFQMGTVSPTPPWTVAAHGMMGARLTFQVNSGTPTGNYTLDLTLTVR